MQSATFTGEVQGGRLHIQEPLAEFEGKQVLVTLTASDAPPAGRGVVGAGGLPRATLEAELLEDPGRIRAAARPTVTVAAQVIAAGRRAPKIQAEE